MSKLSLILNKALGPPICSTATSLFTKALYTFIIIKTAFLIPNIKDSVLFHSFSGGSLVKQLVLAPAQLGMKNPVLFLTATIALFLVLLFCKRYYILNTLAFLISINVSYLAEPFSSGADNVLNLMLFLSIPISSKSLLTPLNETKITFHNFSVLLVQAHIALIYLLSGYNKLISPLWRTGEAISYISSLDFFANPVLTSYQPHSVDFLIAWFVIVFEISFPLLIWFRKCRTPLLATGTIMHLGIFYFLSLPDFGLLMILCYAIFLPLKPQASSLGEV